MILVEPDSYRTEVFLHQLQKNNKIMVKEYEKGHVVGYKCTDWRTASNVRFFGWVDMKAYLFYSCLSIMRWWPASSDQIVGILFDDFIKSSKTQFLFRQFIRLSVFVTSYCFAFKYIQSDSFWFLISIGFYSQDCFSMYLHRSYFSSEDFLLIFIFIWWNSWFASCVSFEICASNYCV